MLRPYAVGYEIYTPWRSLQTTSSICPLYLASIPPPSDIFDSQGNLSFQLTIHFTPSSTSFDTIPRDTLIDQALKSRQTTPHPINGPPTPLLPRPLPSTRRAQSLRHSRRSRSPNSRLALYHLHRTAQRLRPQIRQQPTTPRSRSRDRSRRCES